MRTGVLLLCVATVVAPYAVALAESMSVLHTLVSPNEQANGRFGRSVAGLADVDGDGLPDVLVGAQSEQKAYVISGMAGAPLRTLAPPNPESGGGFGTSVASAGDANGDGHLDFVVGAYLADPAATPDDAGRAYVFLGDTPALPRALSSPNEELSGWFGCSVAGVGDINGDGCSEVIVGAPYENPGDAPTDAGRAYVFDGAAGTVVHTLVSPTEEAYGQPNGRFGWSVSGAGDVDGDGTPDVIVGAPGENPTPGQEGPGRAHVFSGASGTVLWSSASFDMDGGGGFGQAVSGAGDVDGDGHADLIVGAPFDEPDWFTWDCGMAYLFSGATGDTIRSMVSPRSERWGYFGASVSDAGDVDGDGCPDQMVGAPEEDQVPTADTVGRAHVLSGATGAQLAMLQTPNPDEPGYFGVSVSAVGDVTGDGRAEVIVGAYMENPAPSPSDAGRAYIFTPEMLLSGQVAGGLLQLWWTMVPRTAGYWVYGCSGQPYFTPGPGPGYQHRLVVMPPTTTWWGAWSGVGDPDSNWTYLVLAVDATEQELCRSNRFGEHDFGLGAAP